MKYKLAQHDKIMNGISEMRIQQFKPVALVLTIILGACSSGISLTYTPQAATETAYDYYQKLGTLTEEEIAEEKVLLEAAISAAPEAVSAVKLALLLTHDEATGGADEALAVSMLEQITPTNQTENLSNDYRVLAKQWLELLQQRKKARETTLLHEQTLTALNQLQTAYGQLDARYLGLARVLASLEEQNTLLAKQNVLMQQQIEALTVIEQQLAEREQLQVQQ